MKEEGTHPLTGLPPYFAVQHFKGNLDEDLISDRRKHKTVKRYLRCIIQVQPQRGMSGTEQSSSEGWDQSVNSFICHTVGPRKFGDTEFKHV